MRSTSKLLDTYLKNITENTLLFESEKEKDEKSKKEEVIKKLYKKKNELLDQYKDTALEKLKDQAESYGQNLGDEFTEELKNQKKKIMKVYLLKKTTLARDEVMALEKLKRGTIFIAGTSLATYLIYRSYLIYKDVKRNYSRFCVDKSGKELQLCLAQKKLESLKKRAEFLTRSIPQCTKSSNPNACKIKIHNEIYRLKFKIEEQGEEFVDKVTDYNKI